MTNTSDRRNRVNEQGPNDSYYNILENIRGFREELMQWDEFVPAVEKILALGVIFASKNGPLTFICITYMTINRIIINNNQRLSSLDTPPPLHTILAQPGFHYYLDQLQPRDEAATKTCLGIPASLAA